MSNQIYTANGERKGATTQTSRWVTEREYAEIHRLAKQTLSNWRYQDRLAGRTGAGPGYPAYRYFGGAVRYWLPAEDGPEAA